MVSVSDVEYVEDVKVFAWITGPILVAKMTHPFEATVYESRNTLFKRAEQWSEGEVDREEVGQHFFWFLKYALKDILEAKGVPYDAVETRLSVDFGSVVMIGNLNTGD